MTESKKYELTKDSVILHGRTLYRIRALRDFGRVKPGIIKAGELGGFVEKEENLSHKNLCWIHDDAKVFDEARVSGNARIGDGAMVYGEARVYDDASVWKKARVYDRACVHGNADVFGASRVYDKAKVFGVALVNDDALVFGNAVIYGDAQIGGNAQVYGNAEITSNTIIAGNARIAGGKIGNKDKKQHYLLRRDIIHICRNAVIKEDALIESLKDIFDIPDIGPKNDITTFYKSKDGGILVSCGCFAGTIEEYEEKVKETYSGTIYEKQYNLEIELAKAHILSEREGEKDGLER